MREFKCGCCERNTIVQDNMIDLALEYPRNILCDECFLPIKPGDRVYRLPPVQGKTIEDGE